MTTSTPSAIRRICLALAFVSTLVATGCATAPSPEPSREQVQRTALRDLGFNQTEDGGWEMDIAVSMTFTLNDAKLQPSDEAKLTQVASALLAVGIDHLTVEGHTDNQGGVEHNRQLSERRAKVVADALVARGFAPGSIGQRGYGAARPVGDNSSEAGRIRNRRAVLIVPSL
jgi:outer membrane protein OmpA-like peptidoglycan-associated protein